MNISSWSIRHPLPVILLFILLCLGGLIAKSGMKIQDSPDIDFPVILVQVSMPGASPTQLESEVARKIENAVATLPQLRRINTTISDGTIETSVEFRLDKDVGEAIADVRDAVGRVRSDIPPEVRDPVISKLNVAGLPVLTYSVSSDTLDAAALSWLVDSEISKALLALPGVGRVARVGGVEREVVVALDPARLAALNVSAADISRQLQRTEQESAAGRVNIGGARQSVRTLGTVHNVADIAALDMALPDGRSVRLDQVAQVSDGFAEPNAITLLDGKPVVGIEISRSRGAGEIAVAEAVRKAMAKLATSQPRVRIQEAFNAVDAVKDNYAGSMSLLYEGALLSVVVVWFFLRDWRATLVSALALPLSVIPTFLVISWLGFTLNTITLLALALVIGVLVDDAIVEIENIMRHLRMGKSPWQAALDASDEIGLAVVATTFTLVAVFLPTAFMGGFVGAYFKQFGWTAAVAVLMSLLVARLVTPMMAAYLLRPIAAAPADGRMMRAYLRATAWCLAHRGRTLAMAAGFFVLSLGMIAFLPTGFIPAADRGQTQVKLELAPGSTLADTRASAEQARRLIMQEPEVAQVYSALGGGDVRRAVLHVTLKGAAARTRKQSELEAALRGRMLQLPAVRAVVGTGESGEELEILLTGDDPAALRTAAQAVQREARAIPGLGSIYSSISLVRPELIVTPDFARAADLGVTAAAIGDTLRVATAGDYDQVLAKLNLPDRQLPIRVRLPDDARQDIDALEKMTVPGKNGNVPLAAVAALHLDSGPARIDRRDRQRRVVIHVELNGRHLGEIEERMNALPALKQLPPGVSRGTSGDSEMMAELFGGFTLALLTGVFCMYVVLVLLFKGFLQPVTIMAALPLAVGGAFLALLLTRSSLSMPSLLGLLMLMGITAKNSIMLVEYAIRARREEGMSRTAALLDAGHKRARPIIMTTIAMAAGMLPIALGLGADPSFRAPMAIAVIGGLASSTLLSLLVIPALFTWVDDLLLWSLRRVQRRRTGAAPAPALVPETSAMLPESVV